MIKDLCKYLINVFHYYINKYIQIIYYVKFKLLILLYTILHSYLFLHIIIFIIHLRVFNYILHLNQINYH